MTANVSSGNSKPKVLVVDDSESTLIALDAALGNLDCEVIKFNSGLNALEFLETHEAAVILLDVKMPHIGGFEVARLARKLPTSIKTPIIFVTGKEQNQSDIDQMKEVGGFDFLLKPLNIGLLLDVLLRRLMVTAQKSTQTTLKILSP